MSLVLSAAEIAEAFDGGEVDPALAERVEHQVVNETHRRWRLQARDDMLNVLRPARTLWLAERPIRDAEATRLGAAVDIELSYVLDVDPDTGAPTREEPIAAGRYLADAERGWIESRFGCFLPALYRCRCTLGYTDAELMRRGEHHDIDTLAALVAEQIRRAARSDESRTEHLMQGDLPFFQASQMWTRPQLQQLSTIRRRPGLAVFRQPTPQIIQEAI